MIERVLSIGHSNHDLAYFLALLKMHTVTAVADVRSSPFSRVAPHFNRDDLRDALRSEGISYVFLGRELGARSEDDCCYIDGVVSYQKIAETQEFKSGVQRLVAGSKSFRIAMMCSEKEPTECHRTILISRVLESMGVSVAHILGDGTLEIHEHTMLRLLDLLDMPRVDLLMTTDQLVEAAYNERERQIAYRKKGKS